MRHKKLAIGLRLSAARGSIGNAVRQSLGNLSITEYDISNVSGVGVIDHFGARKARYGSGPGERHRHPGRPHLEVQPT